MINKIIGYVVGACGEIFIIAGLLSNPVDAGVLVFAGTFMFLAGYIFTTM